MPSRKLESADLYLMTTKTIKTTIYEKINHYLRNMSKECSVGESSVDALDSPACMEKEALFSHTHKKVIVWDTEKHENGENNTAGSKILEVIVLKLFLRKCTRKFPPIEQREFQKWEQRFAIEIEQQSCFILIPTSANRRHRNTFSKLNLVW